MAQSEQQYDLQKYTFVGDFFILRAISVNKNHDEKTTVNSYCSDFGGINRLQQFSLQTTFVPKR